MRPKTKIVLLALTAVLAAGGWFGYRLLLPEAKVARVSRGTVVHLVPANVVVFPESIMEIKAEQGGRVIKRLAKMGHDVKEGEMLFEIDSTDLKIEIERIEIDYKAANERIKIGSPTRFELATAEENLKNSTRMFETGRLAQVEFDRVKRNIDILKDRIRNEDIANEKELGSLENTLKQKRRALEKMKVLAPADGTIIELAAEPGALIGGGQTLARVISKARRVDAQISEENFAGVRPGLTVKVSFLGYYGQSFAGKVEGVLASADERTKRYTAYLDLAIAPELLAPGLTGEAGIIINEHQNTLKVDRRSLVGNNLYVIRDNRVVLIPVETGFSNQKVVEILSGVQEGDLYITDDLANFKNGQQVRIKEASAKK